MSAFKEISEYISNKTKKEISSNIKKGDAVLHELLKNFNGYIYVNLKVLKYSTDGGRIKFIEDTYKEIRALYRAGIPLRYLMSFNFILEVTFRAQTIRSIKAFKTKEVLKEFEK